MDLSQPSSSSSTLWATATKEWVIPAKPKPGRKPKKDTSQLAPARQIDDVSDQLNAKGRRVQNRAAQRAFRERKQSQLADLQARVQLYEQGEIERNVALQTVAKKLKEENERLRCENQTLKDRILALEQLQTKKRWRDDQPGYVSDKKAKRGTSERGLLALHTSAYSSTPSPPSMASSPESSCDSQASFASPGPSLTNHPLPVMLNILSSTPSKDTVSLPQRATIAAIYGKTFDCGFCNEDTPCICREIALQEHQAALNAGMKSEDPVSADLDPSHSDTNTIILPAAEECSVPPPRKKVPKSILDNLPAFQPAVPLPQRSNRTSPSKPLFRISSPALSQTTNCSGDPNNCAACSNDSFGREFCSQFGEAMAKISKCDGCPDDTSVSATTTTDPSRMHSSPEPDMDTSATTALPQSSVRSQMMPINDAWAQFKAHPNASFADLSLLADVVARRSKCTGPRVELSPEPELGDESLVLLTDPHAHYHERERQRTSIPSSPIELVASQDPSLRLVPQEVLIKCGRQRVGKVQVEAVRDALRFLDTKYASDF